MLFSHAIIVAVNQSVDTAGVNGSSHYVTLLECINPKESIRLFEGTFVSIWASLLYILYFFMGLIAVFGNVLVITAVIKFPWLQVTTNLLVASLATSDLLIGVCIVCDCVLYHFDMCAFHYEECVITTCVQVVAVVASNANLLQASYDRHKYIASPLHYNTTSRKQRLRITIPIVWIYSLVMGVAPVIPTLTSGRSQYKTCTVYKIYPKFIMTIIICVNFYALYVIITVFYVRICKIATQHKRNLSKVMGKGIVGNGPKINWKSTKLLAMITVSLFILSVPYTIVVLYLMYCPQCEIQFPVLLLVYVCFYATTCVNFVIYVWCSKDFKKAFKIIIMAIFRTKEKQPRRNPYKEKHVKQIFKTDKSLNVLSPPARRKYGVAGLEFNRNLSREALSYVHGNNNALYNTQSANNDLSYDKEVSQNSKISKQKVMILSIPNSDNYKSTNANANYETESSLTENQDGFKTEVVTIHNNSDSFHSDKTEEVYTTIKATNHMTRLRHLLNITETNSSKCDAQESSNGQTKQTLKSDKCAINKPHVLNALFFLKKARSLPTRVHPTKPENSPITNDSAPEQDANLSTSKQSKDEDKNFKTSTEERANSNVERINRTNISKLGRVKSDSDLQATLSNSNTFNKTKTLALFHPSCQSYNHNVNKFECLIDNYTRATTCNIVQSVYKGESHMSSTDTVNSLSDKGAFTISSQEFKGTKANIKQQPVREIAISVDTTHDENTDASNKSNIERLKQKSYPRNGWNKERIDVNDNRRESMPAAIDKLHADDFRTLTKADSGFEDYEYGSVYSLQFSDPEP